MPDPFLLVVADHFTGLLSVFAQTAGELAEQTTLIAQASGENLDAGSLGTEEGLGGNFDPLTGEPVGSDAAAGDVPDGAVPAGGEVAGAEEGVPANPNAAPGPRNFFEALFGNPLLLFGGLMILLYFMVLGPERRKQAEITKKRAALKKNDRVVTTGGILGTVVAVSPDSDEVTVRIDDSNNTRIRILKSAIGNVLDPGKDKEKPEASS